ncbi:MAG: DnaD domain protein, partial [archaeon]
MGLAGNNASYTFTRFEIMANTNIFTMDSYRAVKTNYNSAMKNKISFDKFLLQLQENKKSYIEIMDAVNQIAASSNRQNQNLSLKKNKYDELYSGESYEKKDKYLNKNKTSSCSKKSNSDADNNNRKNTIQHEKLNNETVEKLSKAYKKNFGKNIDVGLINVIADYVKKGLTPDLIEHGLDNSINAERNQRKYFLSTLNNWATSDIKTLEDMQNDSKMRKAASSDTYFPSMSGQSKNTGSTDNVDSRTQKKISLYEKEIAAITEKLSKKYQIKIDKSKALSWFEVAGKNISEIENVIKKSDNYEIFKKNVLSVGFK